MMSFDMSCCKKKCCADGGCEPEDCSCDHCHDPKKKVAWLGLDQFGNDSGIELGGAFESLDELLKRIRKGTMVLTDQQGVDRSLVEEYLNDFLLPILEVQLQRLAQESYAEGHGIGLKTRNCCEHKACCSKRQ